MHRGYIKIWRKIDESGLLQMPNTLALFMFILMNATHKDKKVGTKTGVVSLKRGQWIGGRIRLAELLEQGEQQIRTSLTRLESMEIITIKSTSKYSVYTIVNYELYQEDNQQLTSILTSRQPAGNQLVTTKQECKELNTKYIPPIPAELLSDFMKVRKAKKMGEVTRTVFSAIEREAVKAGINPEQAIRISCENGWAGFKAHWLDNNPAVKKTTDDIFAGAI